MLMKPGWKRGSDATTGGSVKTVQQKFLLGDLNLNLGVTASKGQTVATMISSRLDCLVALLRVLLTCFSLSTTGLPGLYFIIRSSCSVLHQHWGSLWVFCDTIINCYTYKKLVGFPVEGDQIWHNHGAMKWKVQTSLSASYLNHAKNCSSSNSHSRLPSEASP